MTALTTFSKVQQIASLIDHTLLKPEAAETNLIQLCQQAVEYRFAAVCVNPCWVPIAHSKLAGSKVRTCTVVGFPLGANQTAVKLQEAKLATSEGASEVDMVINLGALRSGQTDRVAEEIHLLAAQTHADGAILKVILETCLLTAEEKVIACRLSKEAGADFVKTSTGFSSAGATAADVALMRSLVGPEMGVKASGGVRTLDSLTSMVKAGANRIGTSSGVQIIAEYQSFLAGHAGGQSAAGDGGSY